MIRVLVAEDMRVLREAMVMLLNAEADIDVVEAVESGDEVLSQARVHWPDVVVLDVGLPGTNGLAVAAQLRKERPELKVLLLTALDKPGVVQEALRIGVHGFLPKGVSTKHVIEAIRRVHKGNRALNAELVGAAMEAGDNPLSRREQTILQRVTNGMTAPMIAREFHLAEGTVRNHITSAIQKLSAHNTIDAIRIAERMGWLDNHS
ncbi:response regulator transcription factor [Amycolatopsis sp. cmx-11-12]|uniref:response regulator transcription factor n=1 Tax=Amycolatopsis sp. cmx-11-12 TaxID=2785795 RepID=UPI00391836D1